MAFGGWTVNDFDSVAWTLTQLEPQSPDPLLKKSCRDCIEPDAEIIAIVPTWLLEGERWMILMWNISQVQQRGLSPHQFLDLVCVDVFQTCREVSLCESLFWWLRISTVKPCIRPEAFSLATIMGEAMQHAGTSHAAGRPSSSATGSGSRAITEVKYQILWFQLHTIPKKSIPHYVIVFSQIQDYCFYPEVPLQLPFIQLPLLIQPVIVKPASSCQLASARQRSPRQGRVVILKRSLRRKTPVRKTRKTRKKTKDDDDDDNEENQEHVPLPGGKNDDDEDDFNDLDGMNDLLDLGEDEKASQKKDTTKKKPATSKNVPMKRPAKKHDEAG